MLDGFWETFDSWEVRVHSGEKHPCARRTPTEMCSCGWYLRSKHARGEPLHRPCTIVSLLGRANMRSPARRTIRHYKENEQRLHAGGKYFVDFITSNLRKLYRGKGYVETGGGAMRDIASTEAS